MQNNKIGMYIVFVVAIICLSWDISAQQLTLLKSTDGKYGYKDAVGKEIVPAIYENVVLDEASGLISVKLNNKYGIINKNGMLVADIKYDYSAVSEGLCLVELDKKYGYLDSKGKQVIPLIYDDANLFKEGLARVMQQKKWGIIDKTGKVIAPLKYDAVYGFKNGRAGVVLNLRYGFIDKKGNEIVPVKELYYLRARLASDPSFIIDFKGDFPDAYLDNRFCMGDTLKIKRPIFKECPYCSGFGTYTANERTVYEKVEVEHVKKVGTVTEKTKSHMEYYDNNGKKYYPVNTRTYDAYGLVKDTILIRQKIADKFVCPLVSDSEHEKRKKDNSAGNYYLHEFILIWNNEVEVYYAYPIKRAAKSPFSLTTF
jgi:hypothetical protein